MHGDGDTRGFADRLVAGNVSLRNRSLVDVDVGILFQLLKDGYSTLGVQQRVIEIHIDLELCR